VQKVSEAQPEEGGKAEMNINYLLALLDFGLGAWNLAVDNPFNTFAGAFAIAVGGFMIGVAVEQNRRKEAANK